MKFLIITLAPTLLEKNEYVSYAPYVYEMNLWTKHVDELAILSPVKYEGNLLVSKFDKIPKLFAIPSFSFTSFIAVCNSFLRLPFIIYKLITAMCWADHIHLRCPGNIGLLGCIVQILFPSKIKTAKYAGNWDPNAIQPISYKIQKWILNNTFLTKNMTVLVYGEWGNLSKNIKPFFTATYKDSDKEDIELRILKDEIKFLFIGTLSEGKRPLLAIQIVEELFNKGKEVSLTLFGDGTERNMLEKYIEGRNLNSYVFLKGNKSKEVVKKELQKAHFLLLPSKSEGWPKVVAEAMFWGTLPVVTNISCVPYMLDDGNRGVLIEPNVKEAIIEIERYLSNKTLYRNSSINAINWSRKYTLDTFEAEIAKLLKN